MFMGSLGAVKAAFHSRSAGSLKLRHIEALFEERLPREDDDLPGKAGFVSFRVLLVFAVIVQAAKNTHDTMQDNLRLLGVTPISEGTRNPTTLYKPYIVPRYPIYIYI